MTALGSIAPRRPHDLWPHVDTIIKTTQNGSVITQDWGMRVLAAVAAADATYSARIFPFLLAVLNSCRPKDLGRHAESVRVAAKTAEDKEQMRVALEARLIHLRPGPLKRVQRVLRDMGGDQS